MNLIERLAIGAVMCLWPMSSLAADKIPVAATVACDDRAVRDRINAAVIEEFKKHSGYELTERLPRAMLFLYVNRDVNDRKNPDGWSVAVAHVNNQTIQYLAGSLIDKKEDFVQPLKPLLIDLINSPGSLAHLSVAHLDELSDEKIRGLAESTVATFVEKTSKYLKP